ncbi:MAG: hypothetical protein ABIL09_07930 [Gemmatimonadota bacterium]
MPVYCFTANATRKYPRETVERFFSMAEVPKLVRLPGNRLAFRDIKAEVSGFRNTPGNWPMLSDAAGVAAHQVAAARAKSIRDGVPTEFTPDGRVIFRDRAHRARYLKTIGMHDRDGGYGD